ncbi:hypothetical protein [Natronococcus roseus]|uniref:hypothetical protein n=1 Tax=Natronococcus roseus TaxID=1052014 RepID=UPI00374D5071
MSPDEIEALLRSRADLLAADLRDLDAVGWVEIDVVDEFAQVAYVRCGTRPREEYGESLDITSIYDTGRDHDTEIEWFGGPCYYEASIFASDLEEVTA